MFYLSIGKCQEEKASATNFQREVSLGPLELISFVGFTSRSTFTRELIFSVAWSQRAGTESGDEEFAVGDVQGSTRAKFFSNKPKIGFGLLTRFPRGVALVVLKSTITCCSLPMSSNIEASASRDSTPNIENQAHRLVTSVSAASGRLTGKRGDKLLHLAGGLAPKRTNGLCGHVLVNRQAIVQLAGNLADNRLQAADDVGADSGEGVADEVEHRLQAGHDI
ncbi:hypothetical protein TYRP_023452 [Tyrophagus putrescentiae]|nr:hypothetical protein TYRP_023452 [Tyrophagus putrescentiae]